MFGAARHHATAGSSAGALIAARLVLQRQGSHGNGVADNYEQAIARQNRIEGVIAGAPYPANQDDFRMAFAVGEELVHIMLGWCSND